jgi:hypothetical protein
MEVMMQVGMNREKDFMGGQKRKWPDWYLIVLISIIGPTITACASPDELYLRGAKLKKHGQYREAEGIWRPMAEKGDHSSQLALFSMYNSEEARRLGYEDQEKASYWLLKVVENPNWPKNAENSRGFYKEYLALRYEKGIGTPQDIPKACYWYKEASKEPASFGGSEATSKVEKCVKAGELAR